jgi:FK506-binding protein 8
MSENQVLNETIDNKSDESEVEDLSDMPPLEDFMDQNTDPSVKKKSIRIEDKKEEKELDSEGWLDVLDNGDLKKFVLTKGLVGKPRPERGCLVVIKLITKLLDSQEVIQSESYDSLDIVLGDSDVIQGIDLVIPLMDQKEVSRILIKSRFAYGKLGKGLEIPPNATLDCELHLLSVEWPEEDMVLPIDERIRIGIQSILFSLILLYN